MSAVESIDTEPHCRICDSAGPFQHHRVRDMMFGPGDHFDYRLCAACGCLQIADIPADLSRHYGEGYYSFGERRAPGRLGRFLVRARNRHLTGQFNPLGWVLAQRRPFRALASLQSLSLRPDARPPSLRGSGDSD